MRHENKLNENKVLSYCDALRYMSSTINNYEKAVPHYVKPTNPLSFQNWFPINLPTCRRQVVNPLHQKHKTINCKVWYFPVEYPSTESKMTQRSPKVTCSIQYSKGMSGAETSRETSICRTRTSTESLNVVVQNKENGHNNPNNSHNYHDGIKFYQRVDKGTHNDTQRVARNSFLCGFMFWSIFSVNR